MVRSPIARAPAGGTHPVAEPAATGPSDDPYEKLRKLGELRDAGVLTEDEFEAQKAAILSRL